MIHCGAEICRNFEAAVSREWIETNGRGGFASSTIVGLNTRRYHGLLIAAIQPPVGRLLLLSKLEETLVIERTGELRNLTFPILDLSKCSNGLCLPAYSFRLQPH